MIRLSTFGCISALVIGTWITFANAGGTPTPNVSSARTTNLPTMAASFVHVGDVIIDGKPAMVFNEGGDHVLIIFHGLAPASHAAEDYYPLAQQYASDGWCVIVVRGCEGSYPWEILSAAHWGYQATHEVLNTFSNGRPTAILGHSMGAAAAIHATRTVDGLAAHVIMHTANLDPDIFELAKGPTLFTTGTADDGTFLGFTSPHWTKSSYDVAKSPKALVNVRGNAHTAPAIAPAFGNMEFVAAKNWLDCYARQSPTACAWLGSALCSDPTLEWCEKSGVAPVPSPDKIWSGPFNEIYRDADCPNLGCRDGYTVEQCKNWCQQAVGCNAFNFGADVGSGCCLRGCSDQAVVRPSAFGRVSYRFASAGANGDLILL